jgi:hypothetical protein
MRDAQASSATAKGNQTSGDIKIREILKYTLNSCQSIINEKLQLF